MHWEAFDRALAAGAFDEALAIALAGWRARRHGALADVVDAVASQLPIAALPERDGHEAWLAFAAAPVPDVGTLLATLRKGLPRPRKLDTSNRYVVPEGWLARLAAFDGLADDPRVPRALIAVVRAAPWRVSDNHYDATYRHPLALVARLGDRRILPTLEDLAIAASERRVWRGWQLVNTIEATIATLHDLAEPVLDAAELERCRAVVERFAPPRDAIARAAELLAMIRRDPDDVGAREVYADTLVELGDPAGEFIALQIAAARGKLSADGSARVRSLIRTHGKTWLGDYLHAVLKNVVFERGLLATAELEQNSKASPGTWEAAADDDRLATMHTLHKGRGNETHYTDFVFSPKMTNLRSVSLWSLKMLERIEKATEPLPFRHVEFVKAQKRAAFARLVAASALPELETITVPISQAQLDGRSIVEFATVARDRGLEELRFLPLSDYRGIPRIDRKALLEAAAIAAPATIASSYDGHRVRLRRRDSRAGGDGGLEVELALGGYAGSVIDAPAIGELLRELAPDTLVVRDTRVSAARGFAELLEVLAPFSPRLPASWAPAAQVDQN